VFIHRKPLDEFWDGKREMVNAPLPHLDRPGLLWQLDVDELWTRKQILDVHQAFKADPTRTAAYFWCEYFVGPKRIVGTRFNYAQNPRQEWLRVWRFQPGMVWAAHEPPILKQPTPDGEGLNVAAVNPFDQDEMEAMGAVFQHYAYTTVEQAAFKQDYYGYKGAVKAWKGLQASPTEAVFLRDHFAWVEDDTLVRFCPPKLQAERLVEFGEDGRFQRFNLDRMPGPPSGLPKPAGKIVIDGIFFQELNSGIGRVWINLLTAWAQREFGRQVVFLDRAGSAPRLDGVITRTIRAYDASRPGAESLLLQQICDEEGAELFVSTYYTFPVSTPSVFFGHDMIPERLGAPLHTEQTWRNKHLAIAHASAAIMVSKNSAQDLIELGQVRAGAPVHVAYNGCPAVFHPATRDERSAFRGKYGLGGDYLLYLGERRGFHNYKNAVLMFRALARWPGAAEMTVVLVGGHPEIEPELKALWPEGRILRLSLDDDELRAAYSEAYAFVYPSRYEGFGIPILEAMACGAPVIACRNSSIPEVAGGAAALLENADDPEAMAGAMEWLRDPAVRERLSAAGRAQASGFTFGRMAQEVETILTNTLTGLREGRLARPEPSWGIMMETAKGADA
jgi:glycosyltransferase involved in cell wall biosynthesis